MKPETFCVVYYFRDSEARIRKFPNEGTMDRWIRKFLRETEGNSGYWIEFASVNAERMRTYKQTPLVINFGE